MAKLPQPLPISSTSSSGVSSSSRQIRSSLARCASTRDTCGRSNSPHEYVMVGSSISAKKSLEMS